MKKDFIFAPAMILVGILLFMLKTTGLNAHIAISVAGLLVLLVYTILTKKQWKIPALEVIMRACYGLALISGVVIMNVHSIEAIAIIHKATAALFVALMIVLFVHKLVKSKKA